MSNECCDSEVVASILAEDYEITHSIEECDLLLLNTCSVRDNAEQRIRKRLREFKALKTKRFVTNRLAGLYG